MTTEATIAALQARNAWLRAEVAAVQKTPPALTALLERVKDPDGQCVCHGPFWARAAKTEPTSPLRGAEATNATGILSGSGGTAAHDGWTLRFYASRAPSSSLPSRMPSVGIPRSPAWRPPTSPSIQPDLRDGD